MEGARPTCVFLFQDDFESMTKWVSQYPDRETGGQIFGFWTHSRSPYISVVIGPGEKCRHETHSFHQDIEYLRNVGEYLNKEYMMCHIGEWHSHHRLRLREPSTGDLKSIWNNFPEGVEYFLLVIATIESDGVKLWPWIFSAKSRSHEKIPVKTIERRNVFMMEETVQKEISIGAETEVASPVPKVVHRPEKKKVDLDRGYRRNDQLWFESDQGSQFVQLLHADLEKLIDKGHEVEKVFIVKEQSLELKFRRLNANYVIHFPSDFPNSEVTITCTRQGYQKPWQWTVKTEFADRRNSYAPFSQRLVKSIHSFESGKTLKHQRN